MSTTVYPKFDGRARRLIDVRTHGDKRVTAWLEDDFHHFGVSIDHDGERVCSTIVTSPRHPFTTCPGAGQALTKLHGAPLEMRASDIGKWINMRLQCTHVFDLAGLCLAHAAAKRDLRRYESIVEDRIVLETLEDGRRILGQGNAKLYLNNELVLDWELERTDIIGPSPWKGLSLGQGFRQYTEELDVETAEHATVLRRAIMVAGGRSSNRAARLDPRFNPKPAVCHTYQPEQRAIARSIPESLRNWEESSKGMLSELEEKDVP